MNIGWLSASPQATTGYGGQSFWVVNELLKRHKVICIAQLSDTIVWGAQQHVSMPNGEVTVVPLTSPPTDIINSTYIPTYKLDIIIGFMDGFGIEYLNDVRVPVIGWIPIDGNFTEKWKHTVRNFYNVIAYSKFGYRELTKFFPASKIGYIPHSVAPEFFVKQDKDSIRQRLNEAYHIPLDSFLILNVGANVGPRKEIPLMMRTFSRLIKDGYDAHLFLHTNAYSQYPRGYDLITWRRILGMENRIHFPLYNPIVEPVSNDVLAELNSAADLYTQNSVAEGFGLPIAEAMAQGVPIAVPDNSAQTELVGDPVEDTWFNVNHRMGVGNRVRGGPNGWLIDCIDPDIYEQIPVYVPMLSEYKVPDQNSLLEVWKYAIDYPEEVKRKGENAREYVQMYHKPERTAQMWDTYLTSIEEELHLWNELRPVFAVTRP